MAGKNVYLEMAGTRRMIKKYQVGMVFAIYIYRVLKYVEIRV